ncbi:C40 family peptidase [Phycicoccus sp. SLBN-51]|uniref:C40 family peptidase n=1 Tax=Phycicoccus sp. SLBN-51 TaxID=2768447 RepID=UPI001150E23D|nr:C40 family peptidase [Phycicoccus sp. SLBN-51]TQJ49355.1 cell wall-associated NlpC family hydrolase [Phycicoccus sp. SLBN-51]
MPSSHPAHHVFANRTLRLAVTTSLCACLGLATAVAAAADPEPVYPSQQQVDAAKKAATSTAVKVAALDAKYAAASARLVDVQTAAAAAAEAWNGARLELQRKQQAADQARARAGVAQKQADTASLAVRRYAAAVYQQNGSLGDVEAFLSSEGPQELLDRAAALEAVGAARNRTLQEASATAATADTARRQAAQAEAQQVAAAQRAEDARSAAQAQADAAVATAAQIQHEQEQMATELAHLRNTSVALERQRQDGLQAAAEARAAAAAAAEQARLAEARARAARDAAAKKAAQEAAQRARQEAARQAAAVRAAEAAARKAAADKAARDRATAAQQQAPRPADPRPAPQPAPESAPRPTPPPAQSGGVSAVLAYARAQIGKPYQWGAEGPNSFDCSGLTMMAWRQAGVYLSHYTGAQWGETSRVAISDLRPGDLVFYGTDGPTSHHMGLYIGGGRMIEAPYTGAYVREASIYRSDLLPYGGRVG